MNMFHAAPPLSRRKREERLREERAKPARRSFAFHEVSQQSAPERASGSKDFSDPKNKLHGWSFHLEFYERLVSIICRLSER
jgi:hypothetical protein